MANNPLTCTPADVVAYQPCAQCLSERELMAILVILTGILVNEGLPRGDSAAEMWLNGASCWDCIPDRGQLEALVKIIHAKVVELEYDTSSVGELRQMAACLVCAEPSLVRAQILSNLCAWIKIVAIIT